MMKELEEYYKNLIEDKESVILYWKFIEPQAQKFIRAYNEN